MVCFLCTWMQDEPVLEVLCPAWCHSQARLQTIIICSCLSTCMVSNPGGATLIFKTHLSLPHPSHSAVRQEVAILEVPYLLEVWT
jgi:hypothetical protein